MGNDQKQSTFIHNTYRLTMEITAEKSEKEQKPSKKNSRVLKLIKKYKKIIALWSLVSIGLIVTSLLIYYYKAPVDNSFEKIVADLLMFFGQALIGVGLIGGGLGGLINYVVEDFKKREDDIRRQLKERQEEREKQKNFRNKMQTILQKVHDNVELARILIKSHRSGKTYGEQIRNNIIPSLIALKDFKRRLKLVDDTDLEKNLDSLKVSLTYMIAYLSVLREEYQTNYLEISNLQNYQEALTTKMKEVFVESIEEELEALDTKNSNENTLNRIHKLFDEKDIPDHIQMVWDAMKELNYTSDFIDEYRNEDGVKSMYSNYFLEHYYHCNRIIKTEDSSINERLTTRKYFADNLKELKRIEEKKNSKEPLTKKDSLTRKIMEIELRFDFESSKILLDNDK